MNKGLELLSSEAATVVPIKADPRLKLLFELEPRYIAFLDNIADLLSPPKFPPLNLTSPPGDFWPDVFVQTSKPWRSFQESVIWHFVAIIAIWTLSGKGLMLHREPQVRNPLRDAQHVTYYPPSRTYSARASRPVARTRTKAQPATPHQRPLEVAREARRPGGLVVPPDLKSAMARPDLPGSNPVAPSVPLSATARSTTLPPGISSVVAPPPDIKGAGRAGATLQTSVTAPPPDTGGVSAGHNAVSPGAAVISPPPTLQSLVRKIESLFGDSSGGNGSVVPPPPSVTGTAGGRAGSLGNGSPQIVAPPPSVDGIGGPGGGRSLSESASNVVPPPPSVQGLGGGRGNGLASGGSQVIPPPPSMQAGSGTRGRIGSLAAGSRGIVPPPPGIQGVEGGRNSALSAGSPNVVPPPVEGRGGLGGNGFGGSKKSSLSGTGSDIVPPPPSMQGLGGGGNSQSASAAGPGGARNRNALGGLGGDIVPPPPSFDKGSGGGSGGGKGRTAGMPGTGSGIVPPPPSMQGVGTGGTGGRIKSLSAGSGSGVIPPPPSVSGAPGGSGRTASLSGTGSGPGSSVVPPPPSVSSDPAGGSGDGRLAGLSGAPGGGAVAPPPSTSGGGGGAGNGSAGSVGGPASGASGAGGPAGGGGAGSTGPLQQMDDIPDANIPQNPNEPPPGPAEEFPLRLVSLALPTQGSSFFSNYEVFIAERRLPRGQSQLIKLVYTFLPYQKRLSEYIQSNARVYTLRVTRDTTCDESLMQMTWSDTGGDDNIFPNADRNSKLPCYRTTADDYQRALARPQ